MITELLMNSLAGLGLLFYGIKMVTRNLSAMTGEQMRRGMSLVSQHPGIAMTFGALIGFVMQSGRSTAFIMASFVQANIIDVRRAMRVVLWSNFGCTLVIFAAIFPIHLFVLFLLAVGGASIAFERPRSFLNASSASFGLALMLFGLKMVSTTAVSLTTQPSFALALALIKTSLTFAFLFGLALTFLAQSHMAVMLLAVAMASRNIFGLDQAVMIIFGAHAGSSVITYVTGVHFRGQPRQVVMGQMLYNVAGLGVFLAVFLGGQLLPGGAPGLDWLVRGINLSTGGKAAIIALAFNTLTPAMLTLVLPAYHRLCARLVPPLVEEALYRPRYLSETLGQSAVATLMLVEKEQLRLLRRLPAYCAALREPAPAEGEPSPEAYHQAFAQVGDAIARSQSATLSQVMTADDTEWLLNQQKRQELLGILDEACFELWRSTQGVGEDVKPLRDNVVEAVDTLLLYSIDAAADGDDGALDLLDRMTANHGPAMERIRKKYLQLSENLPGEERNHVLQITSIYERAAWAFHRFSALQRIALQHQFKLAEPQRDDRAA